MGVLQGYSSFKTVIKIILTMVIHNFILWVIRTTSSKTSQQRNEQLNTIPPSFLLYFKQQRKVWKEWNQEYYLNHLQDGSNQGGAFSFGEQFESIDCQFLHSVENINGHEKRKTGIHGETLCHANLKQINKATLQTHVFYWFFRTGN